MKDIAEARRRRIGAVHRPEPVGRLLVLALCAGLLGCQSFQPMPRENVRTGSEIRAHLNESGIDAVANVRGELKTSVTGTAVAVDGPRLGLEYWRSDLRTARRFRAQKDTLWLAWSDVVRLDEQRVSAGRTGLFIGGVAVGTAAIVAALLSGGDEQSGGPGPNPDDGPPTSSRLIPLIQFHP